MDMSVGPRFFEPEVYLLCLPLLALPLLFLTEGALLDLKLGFFSALCCLAISGLRRFGVGNFRHQDYSEKGIPGQQIMAIDTYHY